MKRKCLSALALVLVLVMLLPTIMSCDDDPVDTGSGTGSGTGTGTTDTDTGDIPGTDTGKTVPVVRYLRIDTISTNSVVVKLNSIGSDLEFDVKYSSEEITADNFGSATNADATIVKGDGYATITVNGISAGPDSKYYIAVKASSGGLESNVQCVRAGGIDVIPIQYGKVNAVYTGQTNYDCASKVFDEQQMSGDPLNGNVSTFPSSRNETVYSSTDEHYGMIFGPIIDLEYATYVDCIYVYYGSSSYPITVRASETALNYNDAESWNFSETVNSPGINAWNKIEIGAEVQYIQLEYKDGEAPTEALVYGYATGEGDTSVATSSYSVPTMGEMMGMCGLVNCEVTDLMAATVVREYHNIGWSYNYKSFPSKASNFLSPHGTSDVFYTTWTQNGLNVIPCLQWSVDNDPVAHTYNSSTGKLNEQVATYAEKFLPSTYMAYADMVFNYAARYGSNANSEILNVISSHVSGRNPKYGLGIIKWIELGNEPNLENSMGYNAYQLAALTSAAYDGHMSTIGSEEFGDAYFFGAKNADPNMKVAMAGLAGIQNVMIGSMVYWMKANRTDGSIAMDAFNVHTYFGRSYTMNGQTITVGISPEEFGLADALSKLLDYRDKYYPDTEVWLTEFGWDTNESYEAPTASHAYAGYTARQVQAMWLTRAYLILSSIGVDKATMYMCEDVGPEETSIYKYGTCGIVTNTGEKKDAYYYMYTLKNTLADYRFTREISSGNENVWIYEYMDDNGNIGYAVWCPTSDGTKVDNFRLNIGANGATLVENVYGEIEGEKTELIANNGTVTFNVSENPVYIMVTK